MLYTHNYYTNKPCSVSRLAACPTGDQEVAGSTPPVRPHSFYGHSFPSADTRRAVVSFWTKNVHNTG